MSEMDGVIRDFVEAICALAKANCLTGLWDNRRFQLCKQPLAQVDPAYLYQTEKLSRSNVELRAVYRAQIDTFFERLIRLACAVKEEQPASPEGGCRLPESER